MVRGTELMDRERRESAAWQVEIEILPPYPVNATGNQSNYDANLQWLDDVVEAIAEASSNEEEFNKAFENITGLTAVTGTAVAKQYGLNANDPNVTMIVGKVIGIQLGLQSSWTDYPTESPTVLPSLAPTVSPTAGLEYKVVITFYDVRFSGIFKSTLKVESFSNAVKLECTEHGVSQDNIKEVVLDPI